MTRLDTNMILRYLLNDNQEMADIAEEYLNSGDASVTTEVVAEVVYVLKGVYSTERDLVSVVVKDFLKLVSYRETSFFSLTSSLSNTIFIVKRQSSSAETPALTSGRLSLL